MGPDITLGLLVINLQFLKEPGLKSFNDFKTIITIVTALNLGTDASKDEKVFFGDSTKAFQ